MKKTLNLGLVLAAAVAICFALVSPLQSVPPPHANPGAKPIWDITGANWVEHIPNPRFCIYDNGTAGDETDDLVLDKETSLVWERSPDDAYVDWYDAKILCYTKRLANRYGCRLPTMEELLSLLSVSANPVPPIGLPVGHPFINVSSEAYWSSTTRASDTSYALGVGFSPGSGGPFFDKSNNNHLWCVRGGQGYDAY